MAEYTRLAVDDGTGRAYRLGDDRAGTTPIGSALGRVGGHSCQAGLERSRPTRAGPWGWGPGGVSFLPLTPADHSTSVLTTGDLTHAVGTVAIRVWPSRRPVSITVDGAIITVIP
ncbi:MAG TPA: hypothetical protein VES89_11035 [Candidatus Competibacteraceae bacterium]|nr:hypothetical protein [Candidatus Competibacteraceae bacterium]